MEMLYDSLNRAVKRRAFNFKSHCLKKETRRCTYILRVYVIIISIQRDAKSVNSHIPIKYAGQQQDKLLFMHKKR